MKICRDALRDALSIKQRLGAREQKSSSQWTRLYVHIQDTATAKEIWDKLKKVYEDSGLLRKVGLGLLHTLVTTRLESYSSVEEYVSTIISTAHKLNGMSFEVKDKWIGTLLLAELSDEFKPMIMDIENSNTPITGDSIKIKLLQEVKDNVCHKLATGDTALQAKAFPERTSCF